MLISLLKTGRDGAGPGASPHLQPGDMPGHRGGSQGSVEAGLVGLVNPSDVPVVRHLYMEIIIVTRYSSRMENTYLGLSYVSPGRAQGLESRNIILRSKTGLGLSLTYLRC